MCPEYNVLYAGLPSEEYSVSDPSPCNLVFCIHARSALKSMTLSASGVVYFCFYNNRTFQVTTLIGFLLGVGDFGKD